MNKPREVEEIKEAEGAVAVKIRHGVRNILDPSNYILNSNCGKEEEKRWSEEDDDDCDECIVDEKRNIYNQKYKAKEQ